MKSTRFKKLNFKISECRLKLRSSSLTPWLNDFNATPPRSWMKSKYVFRKVGWQKWNCKNLLRVLVGFVWFSHSDLIFRTPLGWLGRSFIRGNQPIGSFSDQLGTGNIKFKLSIWLYFKEPETESETETDSDSITDSDNEKAK